jgi:hypothetical protein
LDPTQPVGRQEESWKIGTRRDKAELAFAAHADIVREVYSISEWLPAGSTFSTRDPRGVREPGRWEFVGTLAGDGIRDKYLDGYVGHYFTKGAQNPVRYVNIE